MKCKRTTKVGHTNSRPTGDLILITHVSAILRNTVEKLKKMKQLKLDCHLTPFRAAEVHYVFN